MSLKTRSYQKELLDGDDIPFSDIIVNMQELEKVNRLLGGHKVTCSGVNYFLDKIITTTKPLSIAEIGCGGGDNLNAIHHFLKQKNIPVHLTGIDIKPECIEFAKQQYDQLDAEWIVSDYNLVQWQDNKPDIIFSSLFCHHFTDDELVEQLRWLKRNSGTGFFINDLRRHPFAYYAISILTKMFSASYLVKNDAPLSVKRSFIKADWVRLLHIAGMKEYMISHRWAFRYLVCFKSKL